ncbi:hypothetical protein P0082_07605 [Candidatus Haliotispira prima]|uniref:Abortive infection protein-like C-terminal domain-containing protein n=1 Tax=Candidatus Haliotispira prima TaxID=3034016 RepID=A0ABY8MED4_9SPIO|nr:hypothetical protein P0082_07605 [Candidatus Haliotispira prima]
MVWLWGLAGSEARINVLVWGRLGIKMVYSLYSKREKKQRGESPDVYTYDLLPKELCVQIIQIWMTINDQKNYSVDTRKVYKKITEILYHEYGIFQFPINKIYNNNHREADFLNLRNYLLELNDIERQLDIVELSFRVIKDYTRVGGIRTVDHKIDELNFRFKENGVGYQLEGDKIIKINNELIHEEAVKPALGFLRGKIYKGAQEEYLKAYEHYRKGNYKESLNDCLKAFESTMIAICNKKKWKYPAKPTAKQLINVCKKNGLIPEYWESQNHALVNLLEGSIPIGRNKNSGHGQGTTLTKISEHMVSYMLHMTASTILFLAKCNEALSKKK